MGKIESLRGTTPAEIFESGLENIEEIEAVAVSVLWRDGRVTAGWSNIDLAPLTLLVRMLDEKHRRENFG